MILSAIWTGIAVANRLVRPIRQLDRRGSEEVSGGNLDIRVPVRASDGDVGYLGQTFNSMLGQLKEQRDEILHATELIDQRRRFSEAVLSGVSAGVMGVDDEGRDHGRQPPGRAHSGNRRRDRRRATLTKFHRMSPQVLEEVRNSERTGCAPAGHVPRPRRPRARAQHPGHRRS
jgi:HAMP domain-containing protein